MKHALYIDKKTGNPYNGIVYKEREFPTSDTFPPDCELIIFDQRTANYDLLYAMLVEDPTHIAADYVPAFIGGLTYDFASQEFKFKKLEKPDLIEEVRNERNRLLALTDQCMLVPDYPEKLKEEILNYRQELRDITNLITPETKSILDIKWPTLPHFV